MTRMRGQLRQQKNRTGVRRRRNIDERRKGKAGRHRQCGKRRGSRAAHDALGFAKRVEGIFFICQVGYVSIYVGCDKRVTFGFFPVI